LAHMGFMLTGPMRPNCLVKVAWINQSAFHTVGNQLKLARRLNPTPSGSVDTAKTRLPGQDP